MRDDIKNVYPDFAMAPVDHPNADDDDDDDAELIAEESSLIAEYMEPRIVSKFCLDMCWISGADFTYAISGSTSSFMHSMK